MNGTFSRRFARLLVLISFFGSATCVAQRYVAASPAGAGLARNTVGQWDRFESVVENDRRYDDPYRDVELTVRYVRPDGTAVDFWGFHDGADTWRIRFMPDRLGTWRYTAKFSDGAPGAEGRFEVTPSDIPGLIHKDEANPIWFGFKGGKHFMPRSFHGGPPLFDPSWGGEKRKAFLDWAQARGYNTLSVGRHMRAAEGNQPRLWPLAAAEYRKVEAVMNDLARRRIIVYPFQGFFPASGGLAPAAEADQRLLIKYMLARFGPYWNYVFNVSGAEPNLRDTIAPKDISRLGVMIADLDVFGHLLGVHNKDGDDPYRTSPWSSYLTLQHEVIDLDHLSAYILWNHTGTKPVYGQETCWAGNTLQFDPFEKTGGCTPERLRQQMWVHMMSAAAFNAGDMNGRSSSGFSGSLELADEVRERHELPKMIWDFMESVPFYRMSPHQDLVTAGFCLAEPGEHYLVYLPAGGSLDIRLEGKKSYEAVWVNARDTKDRRPAGRITNGRGLEAPDGNDWVIHLRRVGANSTPEKEDV